MTTKTDVVFADTRGSIATAVGEVFEHYGGAEALLKTSRDVYLKVNLVDSKRYSYTDPEVIRETIRYFQGRGAGKIYVIENCTQGNFTRLIFEATGVGRICRELGAIPVCLDETGAHPVYLEGLQSFVDISSFVYERLVVNRDHNLYVSLPKLKTHSMSQVTLSIKNQYGLVHQGSRSADHNFKLHQKFADIYQLLRPDFVIVDGLVATNHGHYIPMALADRCVLPKHCLFGGDDPLAVDVVGAAFLGFSLADVNHLALASVTGIGVSDLDDISIVNREIFDERREELTGDLLHGFPADITVLRGATRCCREGCWRNTETIVEFLRADHAGQGGFTIVMGKDVDAAAIRRIDGRVHIAGSCAIQDHGLALKRAFGGKRVTLSHGCNNLAETVYGLCKQMKVRPLDLASINPVRALALLAQARLRRSKAIIPPLL